VQAIGRQPQRAPDDTRVHYERHHPEQTTLYRVVQQQAATFIAQAEEAGLPNDAAVSTHPIPELPV